MYSHGTENITAITLNITSGFSLHISTILVVGDGAHPDTQGNDPWHLNTSHITGFFASFLADSLPLVCPPVPRFPPTKRCIPRFRLHPPPPVFSSPTWRLLLEDTDTEVRHHANTHIFQQIMVPECEAVHLLFS